MSTSRRAVDGTYTMADAATDWSDWLKSSTQYAVGVADGFWGSPPPESLYVGTWFIEMTVLATVRKRPLTLRTDGLRAIGETILIGPTQITFLPAVVPEKCDTFRVEVPMTEFQSGRTLLFVGDIVDAETGETVTDTLIANNREGGLVR